MKNIKFAFDILALCWLPLSIFAQPGITENRSVTFLHGLQGNANNWRPFTTFFSGQDNRRMNVNNTSFTSQGGLEAIATDAREKSILNANAIAICHSMGGVIARRIDRTATAPTERFGGIITVGSPLDGAPVANSIVNGNVATAVSDGISCLSRGPWASLGLLNFAIPIFGNIGTVYVLPNSIAEKLDATSFGGSATINDLKVSGSGIEQDKNAAPTNTPKISIWGNENSPIHWHILESQLGKPIGQYADIASYVYLAGAITHGAIAVFNWWNPYGWYNAWASYEWYVGYDWIANDSERIYNNLIGSDMVVQQCYTVQRDYYYWNQDCDDATVEQWRRCRLIYGGTIPVNYCDQVHNNGISDAFIPAVSQRGDGSRSWRVGGQLVTTREALEINHEEELHPNANNNVMQNIFAEIFRAEPGTGIDPVFQINKR
jgi:pimeloyl-ACP methyl ester carboxylesterase